VTWEDISGWFDFYTLYDDVVNTLPGGVLVEVGCFLGRSLCYLGAKAKESGKTFRVVGVDHCRGSGKEGTTQTDHHHTAVDRGGGTFAGELHRNVIECGLADTVSVLVADSTVAASLFAPRSLGMVFLDAKHDYGGLRKDVEAWLPKIDRGGFLAGDDVGVPDDSPQERIWPDVKVVLDDTLPGWQYVPHDAWKYEVR
jgi:hypothetical protein